MRAAVISIAAILTLISTNYPPRVASGNTKTDIKIESVYTKTVSKFPDRSKEIALAQAQDAEDVRLAQIEAVKKQEQALIAPTPTIKEKPVADGVKGFIYMKESGNNPMARNSSGCLGLGQACPGSKLLAVCPDLNYACQDGFFTAYANARYGGWGGAYEFWSSHHWW